MYTVGKIINTHGIHGEVKVKRITDLEERFHVGETIYIRLDDSEVISLVIDKHRVHHQFDLLHFKGFDQIDDVTPFKGKYLKIKEEQLTELSEDEYYYHEIIGCKVLTMDHEEVGKIEAILSPGANDVWVVKTKEGKEILIPFIKDVVKHIDVQNKLVKIEPMEGLLH